MGWNPKKCWHSVLVQGIIKNDGNRIFLSDISRKYGQFDGFGPQTVLKIL